MNDEIVIERLDPWMTPPEESECWIKNAKGEIVGYKNIRLMTREEIKEKFDVTIDQ